jgi:GAF domain-containing protein
VLAIPIVNQHALTAVVLYGGHVNGTLLDPDEIELLSELAKAAATSHQQVRIATLTRETETQRSRIGELEASTAELRELVRQRLTGAGESK